MLSGGEPYAQHFLGEDVGTEGYPPPAGNCPLSGRGKSETIPLQVASGYQSLSDWTDHDEDRSLLDDLAVTADLSIRSDSGVMSLRNHCKHDMPSSSLTSHDESTLASLLQAADKCEVTKVKNNDSVKQDEEWSNAGHASRRSNAEG